MGSICLMGAPSLCEFNGNFDGVIVHVGEVFDTSSEGVPG